MNETLPAKSSDLRLMVLAPASNVVEKEEASSKAGITALPDSVPPLFPEFLTDLTGSAPSKDLATFAGYTSHPPLSLRTKYYSADVNLWCDELPHLAKVPGSASHDDLSDWKLQMLSAEAEEVRAVIGGFVLLLPATTSAAKPGKMQKDETEGYFHYVTAVSELRDAIEDESGREIATIVVLQDTTPVAALERIPQPEHATALANTAQALEDACLSDHGIFGWDIVAWQPPKSVSPTTADTSESIALRVSREQAAARERSVNEYGEKTGMARVVEVLEQVNWSTGATSGDAGDDELDPDSDHFSLDVDDEYTDVPDLRPRIDSRLLDGRGPVTRQSDELQREIMGMHFALEEQSQRQTAGDAESGDDQSIEQLVGLMDRVVAIREAGFEMSKADREKFAKREVGRIMKEFDLK